MRISKETEKLIRMDDFDARRIVRVLKIHHHWQMALRGQDELSNDQLPMLVRFRDSKYPKTIEIVRPDELFRFFGDGVSRRRVTIEMTRDPITAGVEKYLPSLEQKRDSWSGPGPCYGDPRRVSKDDFIR